MFVYTQATRESCLEWRSLHKDLVVKLMMCCIGGLGAATFWPLHPGASCLPDGKVRIYHMFCAFLAPAMHKRVLNIKLHFVSLSIVQLQENTREYRTLSSASKRESYT